MCSWFWSWFVTEVLAQTLDKSYIRSGYGEKKYRLFEGGRESQ